MSGLSDDDDDEDFHKVRFMTMLIKCVKEKKRRRKNFNLGHNSY